MPSKSFVFVVLVSAAMTCPMAVFAAEPTGSVYLAGNRLVAPQLIKQGDSIFVNGYLAWPYSHTVTVNQTTVRSRTVSPIAIARQRAITELLTLKRHGQVITPPLVAGIFAQQEEADSTKVADNGENVWVHWKAGFWEEINPTTLLEPISPSSTGISLTQAMFDVWDRTLKAGGNIYIGWDAVLNTNYCIVVPGSQVTFFDQGFRGQSERAEVRRRFTERYGAVKADLERPGDLDALPRR